MHVCMYVSLRFPFAPQYFPQKHGFFQRFLKEDVQKTEFFQILGKRMQEAQASRKAGRGNRAWDPCFATAATERHQIAARYVGDPPQKKTKTYVFDVGRGWGKGGGLSSIL